MADFTGADLSGSRFERVDLTRCASSTTSTCRAPSSAGSTSRASRCAASSWCDVRIDGEICDLVVNGVDVAPLVEAELDRRDPDRAKMRPTDPAGFREAWDVVERLWARTVERARGCDPELLHESVDGEWSFIETLRHLAFATDAWVRRGSLATPRPWHPLDLPWDEMPDTPGVPRDREVRPSLDEALELRRDRMATVRARRRRPHRRVASRPTPSRSRRPGWPPPRSYPVRDCLLVVLNEEWQHRQFAERDLDALEHDT